MFSLKQDLSSLHYASSSCGTGLSLGLGPESYSLDLETNLYQMNFKRNEEKILLPSSLKVDSGVSTLSNKVRSDDLNDNMEKGKLDID